MLRTIPGFGNRGSSATYRPALREPALGPSSPRSRDQAVQAESEGRAIGDKRQQPVASAAVEFAGSDTPRDVHGLGTLASCGAEMYRDVRRASPSVVAAALQQAVAEQSCRADAETQRRRQGDIVLRHLGGPFVRGAERHKDGGSEAGRSDCGTLQVDLLGAALGHRAEWRWLWTGDGRPVVVRWHDPGGGSSPLGPFPVCRELKVSSESPTREHASMMETAPKPLPPALSSPAPSRTAAS